MLNLIIVEKNDEQRKQLYELVDWGRLGYEVAGLYNEGLAAMEAILRLWPDLVITNGVLPGMSGIELIKNAREHGLSCDFIITENAGDFELARAAMRLGVQDYLIKPVGEEELTHILMKYIERRNAINGKDINEHFLQTRRLLRNSFMDIFTTAGASEEFSISSLNKRYRFLFQEGVFQCAVAVINDLPHGEESVFLPAVVENARARFDPVCYEMVPYIYGPGRLMLVFNYNEQGQARARLPELEDIICEHLQKRGCAMAKYSIGFGLPETDVQKLRQAQITAERAVRCGMLREHNKQYFYENLEFDKLTSVDILTQTVVSELNTSAESLNIERFEKALRSAFSPVSPRTNPGIVMDICWSAVEAVGQVCKVSGDNIMLPQENKDVLDMLGEYPTLSAMISALVSWSKRKFESCLKEREYTRPVRDAKRYIEKNCTQPLTLERVAEQVHLNASYFSTAFKKETGKNFSEYLSDCRISEAKRLLRESNLSIAQICTAVGYVDNKHFSRLFTKSVGLKPSAYRALHG